MSLPEEPIVMDAVSGTPQPTLGQESAGVHGTELSAAHQIELLRAENENLRIQLEEADVRLLHSRICYQSEAQGRQSEAQIRQTIQQGLDTVQRKYFQLTTSYKSRLSKYDRERVKLLEDNRITEELAASQKQLIEMYEARDRQQQPASHLVEGGPLLSQYNDHNHSSQYPTYQPPRSQEFIIDPTRLHPLNELDYSIGSSIEPSCNTDAVMSTPVAEFEFQAPLQPLQSTPHPASAECDISGPNNTKSDGNKRGLEDEGTKPSKRRKAK